jgi:eukaryotic-like serine/threonine-protein kinase
VPAEQFGPYLVYEELGVGGMATVHRAEIQGVEGFRKLVALKRLHPYLTGTEQIVDSFIREARLASQLQHENIAQTFELGKAEGTYFISMEYVPGPTLAQVMRQCELAAGAIPIPVALGILIQLCQALDYAHNRCDDAGRPLGIIHRDVSPANIVISNTGTVKLLDFGIAKVTGKVENDTPVGIVIKGKFNYIAPEYLDGKLDLRADLFALGVIAHEMLTGKKLFDGEDDFQTSTLVIEMPIHPPSRLRPQIPHELDQLVLTALQRDPDLRWRSASAMQAAVMQFGRETKLVATNQQIVEWVRWAFSQKRSAEHSAEIERLIDQLDQPSSAQIDLTSAQRRELDEFSQPVPTLHGVGSMAAIAQVPPGPRTQPRPLTPEPITTPRNQVTVPTPHAPAKKRGFMKPLLFVLVTIGLGVAGALYALNAGLF